MQNANRILPGLTCLALAACNTLQAQSRVDPQTIAIYPAATPTMTGTCVEKIHGDVRFGAINLDCLTFAGSTDLAYQEASDDRGARNRLAAILLKQSDDVCTVELGRLTANQAMVNTGFSTATTALATAGSIVTGQLAGNILSGLASASNATRNHINAEVYRNLLSAAVTKAIRQERDSQRSTLLGKFSKDFPDYSVDQMIMDVNRYHQVCSFFSGLDLVITAVDRNAYFRNDPRRTAATAIDNVRAQIAAINRQLGRKDISPEEKTELLTQRAALREHETALVKEWTALPAAPEPAGEPQPGPGPAPDTDTDTDTDTESDAGAGR